jgi:hypothetical protein
MSFMWEVPTTAFHQIGMLKRAHRNLLDSQEQLRRRYRLRCVTVAK